MLTLPYRLATLIYIFDDAGRTLLLERTRSPNRGLLSPLGGKLEADVGESPYQCAARELAEEGDVHVPVSSLRLMGMVAERGFEGKGHWLMFCFELLEPIFPAERQMPEGALRWVPMNALEQENIPQTDREIIWPMVRTHSMRLGNPKPEIFSVFIDCTDSEELLISTERD